ncbi:MFS transporter [Actinacidiphila bryophytorum]|uniref:MFS transporter n=1 Tax=Actinacidiphila bryophytorum TaxID=1436133 RepID=A0A9W4E3E4_9ACTN|nr:MFS transporter [Actinacidiphila bryophytorum]MBM9438464.1 MFS transporter [Actinacidiphila bryophytorum]MBN6542543.1 MFS transporter [Actinacidiphila bryophytorum]CAG7613326.1 MFS transporter [Actinacidiphila bryophytorum]
MTDSDTSPSPQPPPSGDDPPPAVPADPTGSRHAPRPAPLWRNRDYNLWWSGTAVSGLGTHISALAFPLLILAVTGSAADAGIAGTCEAAGRVAGLLPAGVAADRYPRRALLAGASLVQAAAMGGVFWAVAAGSPGLPLIAALALAQGLAAAAFTGAAAPIVRRIVPAGQLKAAYARVQARDYGAQLAGAPLGAALFTTARWAPFLADALSFGAVTLACLFVRTPLGPDTPGRTAARPPVLSDLLTGLAYIRSRAFLRYAMLWSAVTNLLLAGLGFMFVVTLRSHGASPSTIGGAEALAAACALGGALAAGQVVQRVPGHRIVLTVSWLLAGGVGSLVLLASRPWLAALCLGASLVLVTPLNVVFTTGVTENVSDAMTARVLTTIGTAAQSLAWLAPAASGALADSFGVDAPVLAIAAGLALLAAANHAVPAVRRLGAASAGNGEAAPHGQER